MFEFEKKIMLTKAEYDRLVECFPNAFSAAQVNYYYDTDDYALNRIGVTCRIREKNGKYKATIKDHRAQKTDCSIERSTIIANRFDDELFKNMNIALQGELKTERICIAAQDGIKIAIDKNKYLDVVDHELEIEYSDGHENEALKLLDRISFLLGYIIGSSEQNNFSERINAGKTKSGRFFARKSEIRRGDRR